MSAANGVRPAVDDAPALPTVPNSRLADGWWPIAFGDEIGQHPGAFRIGGHRLAAYRDRNGVVRAVEDACPHRRLPLSMGRITEDGYLQCGYHGWCFDGETGQCTRIPNLAPDERVPRGLKVAVFSTAETVADALGWALRTPALAPPVGPPTGEEPDAGTTMFHTQTVGRLVFVWIGTQLPSPLDDLSTTAAYTFDRPELSGQVTIRAPHAETCDALVWNPGKLLGLGWLIGAGDEVVGASVHTEDHTVRVSRQRYALDLPRASTYDTPAKRVATHIAATDVRTGRTRITVDDSAHLPAAEISVALTPIGSYRTVIRWSVAFDRAASGLNRSALKVAARASRLHGAARAEAVVDATEDAVDAAVDRLRELRRQAPVVPTDQGDVS